MNPRLQSLVLLKARRKENASWQSEVTNIKKMAKQYL